MSGDERDWTEDVACLEGWLEPERLALIATAVGMDEQERAAFLADPDEFYGTLLDRIENPGVSFHPLSLDAAIETAWREHGQA